MFVIVLQLFNESMTFLLKSKRKSKIKTMLQRHLEWIFLGSLERPKTSHNQRKGKICFQLILISQFFFLS